jgi:tetratricopeptide (TPR) repeat protein/O-antigen ligase
MKTLSFFENLEKISLYLLVFLLPLFFLPFTQNIFDFPKAFLTLVLVSLGLVGFFGKAILEKKIVLKKIPVVYLFFFLLFLSSLFSLFLSPSRPLSFLGSPLEISDSLLTLSLLLITVFLLINSFQKETEFLFLFFLFFLSFTLAGLINLLQIYKIFLFPFDFSKTVSFNTIGTTDTLAVFAVLLLPVSLFLFFKSHRFFKFFFGLSSLIIFLNCLLIDFKTAWFLAILETIFLFVFSLEPNKTNFSWVFVLMAVLILAVFFYFFPFSLFGFPSLPPEVSLSLPAEVQILKGVFNQGIKSSIFGSGPATFFIDYTRYRQSSINNTVFWAVRFQKGHSFFWDWFITRGIFGGLVLVLFYLCLLVLIFRKIRKEFSEIRIGLAASLFGAIFATIFYPFNFSLLFLFWFLLAGFLFFSDFETKEINLLSPQKTFAFNLLFVLLIAVGFGLIFIQSQQILAESNYLKALRAFQNGNLDEAIRFCQKAISLNPRFDLYQRDLSQFYLAKINLISQNQNLSLEEKRNQVQLALNNGAQAIQQATKLAPFNVANWNVKGFFYQNLIGVEGAEKSTIESYQKAIELEPSSPYAFGELARVYILIAQGFSQKQEKERAEQNLNLAIENLKKALELKPDYSPAHFLLAVAYDQLGQKDEAISKLETAKTLSPADFGLALQLGLLYWRKGELEKAQAEFERALNLNPDYANARYMLGLVYDKKGEKEKAIKEFEKVSELNPQNEEVKKILENLKKGLPALEGIFPSQPPISETPSEIRQ